VRFLQSTPLILGRWLPSSLVNVIWRTLFVMWRARSRVRREGLIAPTALSRIRVTTLPTDIDVLHHMNNGRYLSLFDLGRWDLLTRTGMADSMKRHGWYGVVVAETITFRKSLELWQRFDVESRMIGHDDKAIYLEHRAVVDGEVYAQAIIRSRMLKRSGGTLSHEELFGAIGRPDAVPEVDQWVHDWVAASALPSTREDAPSIWQ
jgi:acyl-CoA thioesterase FadM